MMPILKAKIFIDSYNWTIIQIPLLAKTTIRWNNHYPAVNWINGFWIRKEKKEENWEETEKGKQRDKEKGIMERRNSVYMKYIHLWTVRGLP